MEKLRNLQLKGADQKTIVADVFFNMDSFNKPVVIFNHGFKGFKDWGIWDLIAEDFANNGFVFIKFNQTHNGTTTENPLEFGDLELFGKNTYTNELTDINAVVEWVKNNPTLPLDLINKEDIYLMGHSRGASTVIIVGSKMPAIKKIVAWAPFKDIGERYAGSEFAEWGPDNPVFIENSRTKQLMPQYYEVWEDYLTHKNEYDIKACMGAIKGKILLVHGTEDPTVLFNDSLALKAYNSRAQLFLVPNANHVFGGGHPYTQETLPSYAQIAAQESIKFLKAD